MPNQGYKTIFIVDPVKNERIQLAKFIKHDKFTLAAYVSIADCFKRDAMLFPNLIIFVPRTGKSEIKHLMNIKRKYKSIPVIILTNTEGEEVNLMALQESGFQHAHKAGSNEKVREIAYEILAPEGLLLRAETPHPVPIP